MNINDLTSHDVYSVFVLYRDLFENNNFDLLGVGEDFECAKIIAQSKIRELKKFYKDFDCCYFPTSRTWCIKYEKTKTCEIQIRRSKIYNSKKNLSL